jgi:hypothetical protein
MATQTADIGFEAPSRTYVIQSLVNSFGKAKAKQLWREVCQEAGVDRKSNDIHDLEKIANVLSNKSGAAGVVGKSLSVRMITYKSMKAA